MPKTKLLIIICFTLLLIIPISAKAFAVKTGDSVYIAKDQIIEGNLYAAGSSITVDGTVTGDVICAGQTVNINGTVEGDVICAGQSVNINGAVNGSVRVVGNSININGQVARNVMAFGAAVNLGTEANVGWDMLIGAATGEIRGKVGRDLYGGVASATIAGEIGKDVRLKIDNQKSNKSGLIIMDEAIIGGNIIYTDKAEALIASGAVIAGEITHNLPKVRKERTITAWGRLYSIFSALVVGLVLISLWHKQIKKLTDKMLDKVGPSIGWGVIIMFLAPIIAILLLITLIGMPLAFILIGVWLIALFISKILVGILIGRGLLKRFWEKKKDSLILAMVIGIVIAWIIFSLPIVGWLLCLVAMWWGLGGIWLYFRKA